MIAPLIRFEHRAPNPLNNSQGMTRGGRFARAAARKKLRDASKRAVQSLHEFTGDPRGMLPLAFEITRISPGTLDAWDGLPASLKPVIDGIADAFALRDDDPRLTWLPPRQRKDGRGVHAIEIRIFEVSAQKATGT